MIFQLYNSLRSLLLPFAAKAKLCDTLREYKVERLLLHHSNASNSDWLIGDRDYCMHNQLHVHLFSFNVSPVLARWLSTHAILPYCSILQALGTLLSHRSENTNTNSSIWHNSAHRILLQGHEIRAFSAKISRTYRVIRHICFRSPGLNPNSTNQNAPLCYICRFTCWSSHFWSEDLGSCKHLQPPRFTLFVLPVFRSDGSWGRSQSEARTRRSSWLGKQVWTPMAMSN